MASIEKSTAHRTLGQLALPYKSYISPEDTNSYFVPGSGDLLTSLRGYAERRPGFSDTVETTPTTFNNLQRLFSWNRYDGTFVRMACDLNSSGFAQVYKQVVGTDASFASIFTDTTNAVFDFVTSNQVVYFSNGNSAKAWDPVNGIRNWGIAIGSVNNASGPNTAGTGADDANYGGTSVWQNPTNVSSAVSFATANAQGSVSLTHFLDATQFGFSIGTTTQITGIKVSFVGANLSGNPSTFVVIPLKAGVQAGTSKSVNPTSTPTTYTLGSTSDLWGTTWVANDINQTTFGFAIQAQGHTGVGTPFEINNCQITVYGLGGPSITVSGSAGSFSATTGYQYVFCYGNSSSGHVSSPTPASASSGAFTNKANISVSLTASTDTQVNQIRLFRSTDSVAVGTTAGTYFEIPTSPYPNTTQNVTDSAVDSTLNITSLAPFPGFNDPPPPGFQPTYFSGRIWMFKNNQVVFSGLEEIINGVPEESFPSGKAGNFWNFDQPLQALSIAGSTLSQTLLPFAAGRLYAVQGSSLDTFRRFQVADREGIRSRVCISTLDGAVAFLDSSSQVWVSDGNMSQEIGRDIRPDLKTLTPANCSITFHKGGEDNWIVLSSGTKLFVYDLDAQIWMPPWNYAGSGTINFLYSCEASAGNYVLMAATTTKALQLNRSQVAGHYNDNGATYQPIANLALKPLIPDYGAYSIKYAEIANQPTKTAVPTGVQIDTNNNKLADVLFQVDDDPTNASTVYTSIATNQVTPQVAFNRGQGFNLIQNIYTMNQPVCRWLGLQIKAANADDNTRIYSVFIGASPFGQR